MVTRGKVRKPARCACSALRVRFAFCGSPARRVECAWYAWHRRAAFRPAPARARAAQARRTRARSSASRATSQAGRAARSAASRTRPGCPRSSGAHLHQRMAAGPRHRLHRVSASCRGARDVLRAVRRPRAWFILTPTCARTRELVRGRSGATPPCLENKGTRPYAASLRNDRKERVYVAHPAKLSVDKVSQHMSRSGPQQSSLEHAPASIHKRNTAARYAAGMTKGII